MSKPVIPSASHSGVPGFTAVGKPDDRLRRKKPGVPDELVPGEGVAVADAGNAANVGQGAMPIPAGGASAAGGAPGAAATPGAAGGWFDSAWTWGGLAVVGGGAAIAYYRHQDDQSAPVALNVAINGNEDDAGLAGQGRGSDADGDALSFSVVGAAPAGVAFNPDGSFSYVPQTEDQALDDGESRTVTFLYVARDGTGSSSPATVTITITGTNDAPVATASVAASSEDDASITGAVLGSDVDGEALTYAVVGTAPAGLTFNADGTFSYVPQAADNALDEGEYNTVTFDYVANDGTTDSAPATVTITVTGANDAPVTGGAASASGSEDDASLSGSVPAGSDVDGEALTYALTAAAPAGLTFNPDGTFSYVPQAVDHALDTGETRTITFDYVAQDGTTTSAAATVTITISGANDAPVSGGVATASGTEDDVSIAGSVPSGSDVDGEALTYMLTAAAPAGLTFNPDGTFSYVPQAVDHALDTGETRTITFDYVANDGSANSAPATVTITVSGANDAPVSGGVATASGTEDDVTIGGSVPAGSDVDGDALSYALTAAAPAGVTFNADGSFSVAPLAADQGLDTGEVRTITFDYVANDGTANSAPATVTVTINGVNDAPVSGGTASTSGSEDDASIAGSVPAGSDVDGEALTYMLTAAAPAGLTFNADGTFSVAPLAADQGLDTGEVRTITFDYVANDGTANSAPATVTVTINGVNDAPVSGGTASASGSEDDASIAGSVPAGSDVDGEALTYMLTAAAPAGLTFNADGTFSYVPQAADNALDTGETRTVTFDYVATDGTTTSSAATVTITISGANDAPVATDDARSTDEDTALVFSAADLVGNDIDFDFETLTVVAVGNAVNGSVSLAGGVVTFTPAANYSGPASFEYTVSDGTTTDTGLVNVTVAPVNDVPVASNATASGGEDDASVAGSVGATDVEMQPLTYALTATAPAGLTFNADGSFSYVPQVADNALDTGESRTVTFDYVANDGADGSAPATVIITINGANDAPVTGGDSSVSGSEDDAELTGSVPVAGDADGEALTYSVFGAAPAGLAFNSDGSFSYRPVAADQAMDDGDSRTITFQYVANDGLVDSAPATVTITIVGANDAPVPELRSYLVEQSGSEFVAQLAASDIEGDAVTGFSVVSGPSHGTLTLSLTGEMRYTPEPGYYGEDAFTYAATDGSATSAPTTVSLTVVPGILHLTSDNDSYSGTAAAETVLGRSGNDNLSGNDGNDVLHGDSGNDSLNGGAGDDILTGGAGNDALTGGVGNDVYVFNRGDGQDTLSNSAGDAGTTLDALRFGTGITISDLVFQRSGNDLVISLANSQDRITVQSFYSSPSSVIDEVRLADGAVLNDVQITALASATGNGNDTVAGSAGDDIALGLGGNDFLAGQGGADFLAGGAGSDYLQGGDGNDIYVFNRGDGQDVIDNYSTDAGATVDVLQFGSGIVLADLSFQRYGQDLVIRIAGGTDEIRLQNQFLGTDFQVDELRLADGAVLTAAQLAALAAQITEGADLLFAGAAPLVVDALGGNDVLTGGAGNDGLTGGAGQDQLSGGAGSDDYFFGLGAGADVIDNYATDGASAVDFINLGAGIVLADLLFHRQGNNLVIRIADSGEQITVQSHFSGSNYEIDGIRFADGSTLDKTAIPPLLSPSEGGDNLTGTAGDDNYSLLGGNDVVYGGTGNDTLAGGEGDDSLSGEAGADVLQGDNGNDTLYGGADGDALGGGTGNDSLYGGAGNDTLVGGVQNDSLSGDDGADIYVFNLGDGQDVINNYGNDYSSTTDVIQFGAGIVLADVTFRNVNNDLYITLNGSSDQIRAIGHFSGSGAYQIDEVRFSDGTVRTAAQIAALLNVATEQSDVLTGTTGADNINALGGDDNVSGVAGNDTLSGGAGNDNLYGGAGNDSLTGGTDSDTLIGEDGSDTYRFAIGDGSDSISNFSNDAASTTDTIQFGAGITQANVTLSSDSQGALIISYNGDVDRVYVHDQYSLDGTNYAIDQVIFGDGATRTAAQIQAVILAGTAGNDYQMGSTTADTVNGQGGNDTIYGRGGADVLSGGAGDDSLVGDSGGYWDQYNAGGNDTLTGGLGSDSLDGGLGSDTYVFNRGDGVDRIWNYASDSASTTDLLRFGTGVLPGELTFTRQDSDLVIRIAGGSDEIRVQWHFSGPEYQIDEVRFTSSATVYTAANIAALVRIPTEGNDYIEGSTGNDNFSLLGGNDVAYGGAGNDTLAGGDGSDSLIGDDGLDSLVGGAGDDYLNGGVGNDTLSGGTGSDNLAGGDGADLYLFSRGDGPDTISNSSSDYAATLDELRFGTGIVLGELTFQRYDNDLIVRITGGSDAISVDNHFVDASYQIDQIRLADGTVLTAAQIASLAVMITAGDDGIIGTVGNDTIDALGGNDVVNAAAGDDSVLGGAGNDTLYGGAGNDMLQGGSGNDSISGDDGNDTYVFNVGDGADIINSINSASTLDVLQLGAGLLSTAAVFTRQNSDLLIDFGGGDSVQVRNHFSSSYYALDEVRFADGTVLTTADVATLALRPTEGNDTLYGGAAAEVIDGLGGNDVIDGGEGNDTLQGGDGNDNVYGSGGDDVLNGGAGSNIVSGGNGNDIVNNGNDGGTLYGDAGNDVLNGGASNETIYGGEGNDTLNGGAGFNTLYGGNGADLISNGHGGGNLYGEGGSDILRGGAGGETLYGGQGNDTLAGGAGNDSLNDDGGSDIFMFGSGDGQDTVSNSNGGADTDIVQFGAGIALADVTFQRSGTSLVIRLNGSGDQLTVSNHFNGSAYEVDEFHFADGAVVTSAQIAGLSAVATAGNDTLNGTDAAEVLDGLAGSDTLYGGGGNDTLIGGSGNDLLVGEAGNDAYVFNRGDGQDNIQNYGADYLATVDALLFGAGITAADLILSRDSSGLIIQLVDSTDRLYVYNQFSSASYVLDELRFADGTVITAAQIPALLVATSGNDYLAGTAGADTLNGLAGSDTLLGAAGNDSLTGGAGSDSLTGGEGGDIYAYSAGDGNDTINNSSTDAASTTDALVFGAGIAVADVTFQRNGSQLYIRVNGGSEQLTVSNHFEASGSYQLDEVRFADGTVVTAAQIAVQTGTPGAGDDYLLGTAAADGIDTLEGNDYASGDAGNDTLAGGAGSDRLYGDLGDDSLSGGDGNDFLYGGEGNDTLAGGAANDQLQGGEGVDTYLFNPGDGQDTIDNYSGTYAATTDVIQLGAGFAPADVMFHRVGSTLYVRFAGSSDTVRVDNHFSGEYYQIDEVRFFDGTVFTAAQIATLAQTITAFNDSITGTSAADVIDALAGDDIVFGGNGNDSLAGGAGNDTLYAEAGNDTLSGGSGFNRLYGGAGNDVLVNGDEGGDLNGEDGDDVLTGGAGNDTLSGGNGNDRYVFAPGSGNDTVNSLGTSSADTDAIEFGSGIALTDLSFSRVANNLVIDVAVGGGSIIVLNHFVSIYSAIDEVRLDDGTVLTAAQIAALMAQASTDDDFVSGGAGAENLDGLSGNDIIDGGAGNDAIAGGTGNDYLRGNIGSDVYVFQAGDGKDIIENAAADGDVAIDAISFGPGITASDIELVNFGNDLVIRLNGGTDEIRVLGHFTSAAARIDELRFDDGSTLTAAQIALLAAGITDGDDYLIATAGDDSVFALGGNDILHGLAGNDMLDGGAGYNTLFGGDGNDTLVNGDGGGQLWGDAGDDTLLGGVNVDQLNGGAGNDSLTGGIGEDTLQGGGGNDRYDGGAGNDTFEDAEPGSGNDLYIYRYGSDGRDTIAESSAADAAGDVDVLEIWGAPAGGGTVTFALDGTDNLFIQVGDDPTQGILIEDFFTQDHTGLNADIEQIAIYSDAGSSLEASYTSQQVLEQLFP